MVANRQEVAIIQSPTIANVITSNDTYCTLIYLHSENTSGILGRYGDCCPIENVWEIYMANQNRFGQPIALTVFLMRLQL